MAAPKLEWKVVRKLGSHDSHLLATVEDWTNSRKYDIKFEFTENGEPRFVAFWTNRINAQHFISVGDAKAWCQAREDEAYAAANPVREFTDAEILTAFINKPIYLSVQGTEFICREMGEPVDYFRGKTRREAVSAYLSANPPATEPEPSPDREMTGLEINETFKSNDLDVLYYPNKDNQDKWRVWKVGYSHLYDCSGSDLFETIAKCLAAIEAAKTRNA